jgi:hypothetical protein
MPDEQKMLELQRLLERIQHMLDEVTHSIMTNWPRTEEGAWPLEPDGDESSVIATALVILWLLRYTPEEFLDPVTKGLDFLVGAQHTKKNDGGKNAGGWGRLAGPDQPNDPTSTALALLAFIRYTDWTKKDKKDTIDPLHKDRPETLYNDYTRTMTDGLGWLKRYLKQNHPPAHANYWICTALSESQNIGRLYDADIEETILPSAEYRVARLIHDGGWGETPTDPPVLAATAYCAYLMLKMNPEGAAAQEGITWMEKHWQHDVSTGAWSPVETNARVIIALLAAGKDPASDLILQGVQHMVASYESPYGWRMHRDGEPHMVANHSACRALLAFQFAAYNKKPAKRSERKLNVQAKDSLDGHGETPDKRETKAVM